MRLIKGQTAEILAFTGMNNLPASYENPDHLIELAGRTCYKSEEKITDDSSSKFVDMIDKRGHHAMIEHSWEARLYTINSEELISTLCNNQFVRILILDKHKTYDSDHIYYVVVVGNKRAIREFHASLWRLTNSLMEPIYAPVEMSELVNMSKKYNRRDLLSMTVKFITNRGVSHELVRHRPPSFAQESTRYCNYSKEKFGNHCTFIIPSWATNIKEGEYDNINFKHLTQDEFQFVAACYDAEWHYFMKLGNSKRPDEARGVLSNDLKTEIIVSADLKEWKHIFNLRYHGTSGAPHFQMKEIMEQLIIKVMPILEKLDIVI